MALKNLSPKAKKRLKTVLKDVFIVLVGIGLLLTGSILFWISTFKVPTLDSFEERKVTQSTKIYDRTGEVLLYDVYQDVKRTVVPFEDISRNVKNATIAIEDAEFYDHFGIKPTAILRAVFANLINLELGQGGSTITQQVVKNSLLTNEKSISRKLKEWVLAIKLEKILTKDEILNLYLNEIPYGGNIYGIEEASQAFFGKSASDLTLTESAYLAAIPQAPTYYSPYGSHVDGLEARKNLVLGEMLKNGFITQDEFDSAQKEKVSFKPKYSQLIKAPHFVFFIKDYLEKNYGEGVLESGGLKVTTTLDYSLQEKGEEITKQYALENATKFNAENAALVAIDPRNGEILTMVGSRDYFDPNIDGNFNIALAHRQPGSVFKPFAYAAAFNKGYTPSTVIFDLETEFSTQCTPDGKERYPGAVCYMPENYDGHFHGPITMREALAQSINIASIKTLYLAGMKETINLAKSMGIQSLGSIDQYGLTLVLGGGEVSLLDATSAYGVFANNGNRVDYNGILKIEDSTGRVLESAHPKSYSVLPKQTALEISDVLGDNVARAPAFGDRSYLYFPGRDVAVKTGTTNDYRDAWIVGYTPNLVVGSWAGNNDNSPMEKKVAGFIIAPMWNAFMNYAISTREISNFEKPLINDDINISPFLRGEWRGGISYLIDRVSGKRATQYTPKATTQEKLSGGIHSILYWIDKDRPLDPAPIKSQDDSQFESWEYAVRKWVTENNVVENNYIPPTTFDDVHVPESFPKISVQAVKNSLQQKITVSISYNGKYPLNKAEFYLDGNFVGSSNSSTFSFFPTDYSSLDGTRVLRVSVYDSVLNRTDSSISI